MTLVVAKAHRAPSPCLLSLRSPRRGLIAALLGLQLLLATDVAAQPAPAAATQKANPAQPAVVAGPVAVAPAPSASQAQGQGQGQAQAAPIDLGQLKREIEDLQGLLDGQLPRHLALPALFEIDLTDEAAVERRGKALAERLASAEAQRQAAPTGIVDEARTLRLARDRLRLAFLQLPADRRNALRERDRLRREGQAVAAEQQATAVALAQTEQARDTALAAADRATDELERRLTTEQARLLTHLSELAALKQSWANDKQERLDRRRALMRRYEAVDAGLQLKPEQADQLYAGIRTDLRGLRGEADNALGMLSAGSMVPRLEGRLDIEQAALSTQAEAVARLRELRARIAAEESVMGAREAVDRYADADEVMSTLRVLQTRRVALLAMLSDERRAEVTGLSGENLDRVLSEVAHVRLMARWYPVQRMHEALGFAALLRNVLVAGRLGAETLALLLVLSLLIYARRRSRDWLRKARAWLAAQLQPQALMMRVDRGMQMLMAVSRELILLLWVYLLFEHILLAQSRFPEVETLGRLAYAYAYYALALAFIHRVLLAAVSRYRVVSPALNHKMLRSLRLVARLLLTFSVFLILAQALLGRGALYGIARQVALVGSLLVGWWLIRDWRSEVTQAYLKVSPQGRLADLVRASQGRSHGLLIAAAAFVFVAARGLWTWISDVALGFEQTRKALAYLFRRQLERQSKAQVAPPDPSRLPAELQAAFTEEAASPELSIDRFPELFETLERAQAMLRGRPGALLALSGERGSGKTTWLQELQRRLGDELPCRLYTFEDRVLDAELLCERLCEMLGVPPTRDPQQLIDAALKRPPQVVLIDLSQKMMLRAVGRLAAYELFVQVAQGTADRVLWVAAFARWPFEYLQRLKPGRDIYDKVIVLREWSEEDIGRLIDARLEASGFEAEFDHLMLNNQALGGPMARGSAAAEAVERTADRYYRLVWDYASGNPRAALHFFRLSLDYKGGKQVTVRLFSMPSLGELEDYEMRTWLVLACLVQHENLTIAEAAESLRFPLGECAHALHMLTRDGYLVCNGNERYRVSNHWSRAVLRFLQRKKLLVI